MNSEAYGSDENKNKNWKQGGSTKQPLTTTGLFRNTDKGTRLMKVN